MKRPNLTPEQVELICELRGERGWSNQRIAKRIGCSLGSVGWALLREGVERHGDALKPLPPVPLEREVRVRNGHEVVRFNQADDERLLELEAAGLNPCEIGRRMNPPRRPHSVLGRLRTLARRAAREEAATARPAREIAA
jgi:hypothetical protein